MNLLQEYKCPCCGGAIEFDSTAQKMKCPYCGTEFDMETLQGYDDALKTEQPDDMQWETAAGGEWQQGETENLRSYVCKSCGGEIVGDETTAATACPFCGNPVVMMGQFAGALRPDYVIPFKLDKKAAKAALMKQYGGKRLLPKVFKDQTILMRSKACMSRSGCLMPMRTPMFAIKPQGFAHGVTATITIPRPVITQSFAAATSDLSECRWTALRKWRMI